MMNRQVVLILAACIGLISAQAWADTWCNSSYPPDPPACHSAAIHCEDVDRICNGAPACPPPPPEPCPGQDWSWMLIRQAFPRTSRINDTGSECGVEFKGEEDTKLFTSYPLGTRYPYGDLGQATIDLSGHIRYTFGSDEYTAVIGTDEHPLILRYDVSGGVASNFHAFWDIGVIELFLDTGEPNRNRSPMDYILVGEDDGTGCINCNSSCPPGQASVPVAWPFICQSYETRTAAPFCPPLQTNVRTAIAVGMNALLDNNPCHCEDAANQKPTNYHLSFYDGLKWRILHPSHPGPSGENAQWSTTAEGKYFVLGAKINTVTMIVKTNTVDITMYAKNTPMGGGTYEAVTSTVTGLKRQYLGHFNKLHAGASIGCRMDSNGACMGNRTCLKSEYDRCDGLGKLAWGAKWLVYDGIALSGGMGYGAPGACCLPGGGCGVTEPGVCDGAGGQFVGPNTTCGSSTCQGACCKPTGECADNTYFDACPGTFQGFGTDCATTVCPCPTPFADADADQDVDQADFARFQACFTGPGSESVTGLCRCFDRDNNGQGDGDVDMDDFSAFEACASGPGIPTACQ